MYVFCIESLPGAAGIILLYNTPAFMAKHGLSMPSPRRAVYIHTHIWNNIQTV